jgi:RNA polymerase sigma factor (TIGR02999 family)
MLGRKPPPANDFEGQRLDTRPETLAALFERAERGDPEATAAVFSALYRELHALAERQLQRHGESLTLGTTSLLHETYLNLSDREGTAFPDRARFLAYASRAMRGLIVDYTRARRAKKRGGEFEITGVGDELAAAGVDSMDNLDRVRGALEDLERVDCGLAELVDLHFFCGLSFVEVAALRSVSERTVQRDWRKARMLLGRMIDDPGDGR